MIACEKGYIEIIEQLIDQQANINLRDVKQRTPIFYAIEAVGENLDVILHLIKKGAIINLASIEGWTPLLKATQKQYHSIIQKLLEHNADPKYKHQYTQNTALHIACENGDLEAVKILVGRADLEVQNKEKDSPLDVVRKQIDKLGHGDPKLARFQEIFSYLKGVWDEREKKASQAKDELVKQEDLNEEREKRKMKSKTHGPAKSSKQGPAQGQLEQEEQKQSELEEGFQPDQKREDNKDGDFQYF